MNRITFPPSAHPFDGPLAAHRLGALRTLCQVMIGALVLITLGVWMVVLKVFGGEPLAGNLVTLGGVSALTWVCGAATLVVAPLAVWVGRNRAEAGLRRMEGRGADEYLEVFAGATFASYAVALAWGFLCAIIFHLTADPVMLGLVAVMVGMLLARFPTTSRARAWFDRAVNPPAPS
jgi:hypothetical protein